MWIKRAFKSHTVFAWSECCHRRSIINIKYFHRRVGICIFAVFKPYYIYMYRVVTGSVRTGTRRKKNKWKSAGKKIKSYLDFRTVAVKFCMLQVCLRIIHDSIRHYINARRDKNKVKEKMRHPYILYRLRTIWYA